MNGARGGEIVTHAHDLAPARPFASDDNRRDVLHSLPQDGPDPGPALRHRPLRHRHVPAGIARHRPQSGRRGRSRAVQPDRLLPRARCGPVALRARVRHGRPQAAAVLRPGPVHAGQHRLCAGHRHSDPGGAAIPAGPGRGRRHGDPTRRGARPAHRRRRGAPDVAADAGVQRLAHPRAAGGQRRDRAHRLARRVLGRGPGLGGWPGPGLRSAAGNPDRGRARGKQLG
ncbi:hypothetical protein FQZ97_867570 [compost metagenome]